MKRCLDDHQDTISSVYSQQHRLTESGGTLQRVLAPAPGHTPTGGLPPSQPFFDGAKSESMQSSVQFPMHSYQMTSGMSQSGHGPASVALHPAHSVQAQQVANQAAALAQAHASQGQQQQFQRLKVEDALSYLDQVKFRFGSQPQVYNDFLDIMKEFKSQSIDTPGVISRVSTLFKGHPELITGFNTFLPPGYKIEVQSNDQVNFSVPGSQTTTVVCTGTGTPVSASGQCTGSSGGSNSSGNGNNGSNQATVVTVNQNHGSTASQSFQNVLSASTSPAPPVQVPGTLPPTTQTSQPVEFNHAISYVNKIKNRFQGQPDIYKQFLEILHTYQKEQRNLKEGISTGTKPLTEAEVYAQVAKLFQDQNDLLEEFGQFLPDANGAAAASLGDVWSSLKAKKAPTKTLNNDHSATVKKPALSKTTNALGTSMGSFCNNQAKQPPPVKRPPSSIGPGPPAKKPKQSGLKDLSLAESSKYGSLAEYAFFDKVRKALRTNEVYDNFLRCLILFNDEVISRTEVVQLVSPFLGKYPELFKWFKDFLGYKDIGPIVEPVPSRVANQERVTGDLAMEIGKLLKLNYSTCKRLGASYCALPKSYVQPKCSGRSPLCKEVLNDTWVSFPTWSEDSTFVSSRKTIYEEYIYRCEDERFELDVVLETNLATIRALEGVHKKLTRMSPEEAARLRLDDCLGGTSQVIHLRAIKRIYGDKAADIIDGLKKNPMVAVPLVLRRLKAKEEEWREAQKNYNKLWRDQNEKYYLKSLDHQGINFKQNDVKALRSKSLLNEIDTLYDERHEQAEEGTGDVQPGPHMTFVYKDKSILDDAANLIIHHTKRQTTAHKDDKRKMKQMIRQFIPDLFFHPRQELSDDEKDDENENVEENYDAASSSDFVSSSAAQKSSSKTNEKCDKKNCDMGNGGKSCLPNGELSDNDRERQRLPNNEAYTCIFVSNHWYFFLRLHQVLCERLTKIYERAFVIAAEEAKDRKDRKESAATSLRLKPKMLLFDGEIEIDDYYPAFLDMIKSLLDGNMESNTYEDTLREMFGIHAYIGFTMDKVVQSIFRQLQHVVGDDMCVNCMELFLEEQKNGATGGTNLAAEQSYQKKAEQLLSDENCYKVYIYKNECRMTIELLDTETDPSEDPADIERWSEYVEKYVSADSMSEELKEQLSKKPVFLPRNVRMWRQQGKRPVHDQPAENDPDKKDKDDFKSKDDDTSNSNSPSEKKLDNEVMDVLEGSQCRFNLNSFKMVFVVNSESYLYKRLAFQKARETHKKVSRNLNAKFHKWHQVWVDKFVSNEAQKATNDWMMGISDGLVPNKTRRMCDNNVQKPPYYAFNKYHVQWLEEAS